MTDIVRRINADFVLLTCAMRSYVKELQARFTFKGPYDTWCLPTGEAFIAVMPGKRDDDSTLTFPCLCTLPSMAIELFKYSFETHIVQKKIQGTLHWRTYPDCHVTSVQLSHTPMPDASPVINHHIISMIYARAVLIGTGNLHGDTART